MDQSAETPQELPNPGFPAFPETASTELRPAEVRPTEQKSADPQQAASSAQPGVPRYIWQGKVGPAFWTIASLLSLTLNVALIVAVIILARHILAVKDLVSVQLVDGLYQNFVKMDQASISTTVKVKDTIPVVFDLHTKTETTVRLTRPTRIKNAVVNVRTGGLTISNSSANITLPAGTNLPIALDMVVPVSTTIPIELSVPVNIALDQTELHEPFVGLQEVLTPYRALLAQVPASWKDTPLCKPATYKLCAWIFKPD